MNALTPDALAWAQRLVRINTVSHLSNLPLIECIADHLRSLQVPLRLTWDDERKKANLFATLGPGKPGGVVLSGHTDTVPWDGQAWSGDPLSGSVQDGRLYGRGSADMKGALACAAEAARVLKQSGPFPGELVIVAIGLHEAPGGRGEDLTWLLREHGFRCDFAVVCELSGDTFVAAHMGQATVEITIEREGMVTHELKTASGTPHPILAAGKVIRAIEARNAELAPVEHPWVGAETYFVGEVHGGDFYNRFPTSCRVVGTRRWAPGNTLEGVEAEFRALLEPIASETGCSIELDLRLVRGAYSIDPEHPLSVALRAGYADVTGTELPLVGIKVVADAAVFQGEAAIPTVYHGPAGSGAHADVEAMPIVELVRATRVYLRTLEHLWA